MAITPRKTFSELGRHSSLAQALRMENISIDFGGVKALKGVNFVAHTSEVHAICGANGAGKSTLMKILSGVYSKQTYQGKLFVDEKECAFHNVRQSESCGIAFVHQELSLFPDMDVVDNMYAGHEISRFGILSREIMEKNVQRVLNDLGVTLDIYTPVKEFGMGILQLIEVGKALLKNATILILDEPTTSLSAHEVTLLFNVLKRLRERACTIIYISHKLEEVMHLADRVTVLRDGQTISTQEITSTSVEHIIFEMTGKSLEHYFPVRENGLRGSLAMSIKHYSLAHPKITGKKLLDDISFELYEGELVGLFGLIGAGRTELAMSLLNVFPEKGMGVVAFADGEGAMKNPATALQRGLSLIPEDRKQHALFLDAPLKDNVTLSILKKMTRWGLIRHVLEIEKVKEVIDMFRIKASSPDLPIKNLSGGNQQKVVMARVLSTHPKILFLDEPTRGVDVSARSDIYQVIANEVSKGMAVLMISSDITELLGMCDRILVMNGGKLSGEFKRPFVNAEKMMAAAAMHMEVSSR